MEEYKAVLDRIDKGCYTIADLADLHREFDPQELEETLEGFVAFGKIKKTRQFFHGIAIIPPEKKTRATTGNSLDCTGVEYPEWVKTDRDKVKFLTSPESPKLSKQMNFFIDDIETKDTGRLLYDSLNSSHIMTSVYLSPNSNDPGNKTDYAKDVSQARGFSVIHREDGTFSIDVSLLKSLQSRYANAKTESYSDRFTKEFSSFESFKKWLLENL